ncbi:MAG: hypothetical protein WDM88_08465 [Galbitalea sp.]
MPGARLAVLGSPIAHSLSPVLHRAAYSVLGLDWEYGAVEMTGAGLADFVASRDSSWRGLSLTMPLKRDVLPLLRSASETAAQTGSANTVRFGEDGLAGFNTDVFGITAGFERHGRRVLETVLILGGGATAASALVAAARLSATRAFVGVRSIERAAALVAIAGPGDRGAAARVRGPDPDRRAAGCRDQHVAERKRASSSPSILTPSRPRRCSTSPIHPGRRRSWSPGRGMTSSAASRCSRCRRSRRCGSS